MGFYETTVLPKLLHFFCGFGIVADQRKKVLPYASGTVLEIGIGSGLNLPFYAVSDVDKVIGLDPSSELRAVARKGAASLDLPVFFIEGSAERIPLSDRSVDTLLVTYTLCTIPHVDTALKEMRRVLKSGGKMIFCEHGLSRDEEVVRWQNRVDSIWPRLSGGCHLNRNITELIEKAGFEIKKLDHLYIPGWKPACFHYLGWAN